MLEVYISFDYPHCPLLVASQNREIYSFLQHAQKGECNERRSSRDTATRRLLLAELFDAVPALVVTRLTRRTALTQKGSTFERALLSSNGARLAA